MANNVLGALTLKMVADLGQLQKDMGKATKMVEKFGTDVKKIIAGIGIGLSVSYFKGIIDGALEAGDSLMKMSAKTGLSTDMLQVLGIAAEMADVPMEKLTGTLIKLQVSMSKAMVGEGKIVGALKKMGIDPKEFKDADELIGDFLDKISKMDDTTASLARISDAVGPKLAANLKVVAAGYKEALDFAQKYNLILSASDLSKLESANDLLKQFAIYSKRAQMILVVELAPAISTIIKFLMELRGSAKKDSLTSIGRWIADGLITAVGWVIVLSGEIEVMINKWQAFFGYLATQFKDKKEITLTDIVKANLMMPKEEIEKQEKQAAEIRAAAQKKRIGLFADYALAQAPKDDKGKPAKVGAADLSSKGAEALKKEMDKYIDIVTKLNSEIAQFSTMDKLKQDIEKANLEWEKQIQDINKLDKISDTYKEKAKKLADELLVKRIDYLQAEKDIKDINNEYKQQLEKENAELERSSILNKAKIDVEKQLADAQLNLRSSRGEDVDLLRLDLDYKKQVADLDRQIADLEGKMNGAAELTQLAYKAQVDALKMQYPILEKILNINKQIKEESDLRKKDPFAGWLDGLKEVSDRYSEYGTLMKNYTIDTFKQMEDAWVDFCVNGKFSFESFVTSVLSGLLRMMTQMLIIAPIAKSLSQAISGIAGAGGGFGGFMFELLGGGGGMFFKQGAAFSHGRVTPFARGDIFNSPTLFPMAGGMGLMGEAGPEAVMPLARGRDGKLGVVASGSSAPNVQIVIKNETGMPINMEQQGMSFDGEKYIIATVMKNADKFGPLFHFMRGGQR